ncbi:hypothetical protein AB0D10_05845 [Kitasatospora sp. NPDC048545]|uniref:hypothetical protein n=1 Tax=Kitasatospora sp. NPDC048545 TaxID=3157208 RepID=UPI0033D1044F
MPEQGPEHSRGFRTVNRISGEVNGPVIQADMIIGDIHVGPDGVRHQGVAPVVSVELFGTSSTFVSYEADDQRLRNVCVGVKVLVEGLTAQAVVLRGLRPVIDARRPARPAAITAGMAAPLGERGFEVDLDAESPLLVAASPGVPDFPYTVTNGDPELFAIAPRSSFEVDWHLELDWTSAGRSGTVVIDRGGHPFEFLPEPTAWAPPPPPSATTAVGPWAPPVAGGARPPSRLADPDVRT